MKILVVGFPRSGTSLTHRIFEKHPDVKRMFFESWMLKKASSKKDLINRFALFKQTCGEKVIWEKKVTGKFGKTDQTIVDYCLKWNEWFQDEAKIIQIVRHPFDSLNSLIILKKKAPRGPSFEKTYAQFLNCASRFINDMKSIPNCFTIKYEDLVMNPDNTIKKLYEHCEINPTHKHQEKMKTKRIFNYKDREFLFEYNSRLEGIIQTMNDISGVEYHGM